jgi:hypothetical protein
VARKAFFAAFIVDEDNYTPEPGPVDHHFVAADLAQSGFGEQPGVSQIIVWNSAADLVADHCQRGPISVDYLSGDQPAPKSRFVHTPETCPTNHRNHRNHGNDIGADSGADLSATLNHVAKPPAGDSPSFRDQLFPTMRETLAFEYYEVRPCIERHRQVTSYRDEDEFEAELARSPQAGREFRAFWSLYGVDRNTTSAIGDFVSKDAAHEVMNAILAIPAAARNALQAARPAGGGRSDSIDRAIRSATDWLEDMINQSSNDQRI